MIELASTPSTARASRPCATGPTGRSTAAAPLGDRTLMATALAARASGSALAGTAAEAQAHREEAAELIDQLSDDELAGSLDGLTHLATAEMYLDHYEAAGRHAQRALTIGRATGQGDLFPLIFPTLGRLTVGAGPHAGIRRRCSTGRSRRRASWATSTDLPGTS